MSKPDIHNFIAADLIKRNSVLLHKELVKRGRGVDWPLTAKKICVAELRANTLPEDLKRRLKAISGFLWSWLREQNITTREIYIMLVSWLVEVETSVFTQAFDDLCEEFGVSIEAGYKGTIDIEQGAIQEEWQLMDKSYLPVFKEMIDDMLKEEGLF